MDFNAHTIENFLSPEEIKILLDVCTLGDDTWAAANPYSNSTFKDRAIPLGKVKETSTPAYRLLRDEIFPRIRTALIKQYAPEEPIYPDLISLIRWPIGMKQDPHWDDMKGLGDEINNGHRKYGVIIYLNDDYEGGQLFYPKFNYYITPKAGMLAMHPGDELHEHGVTEVQKGSRYTVASFWHHTRSKIDTPEFFDEYYAETGSLIPTE